MSSISLNPEQKRAAGFTHGVCAVIAVPGSGKTLTMTHRIANLINTHGVAPEAILGLTFTRNAADEMRRRLRMVLDDQADRVTLSTIHGFCYWLLKSRGRSFEVLSPKEQFALTRKIVGERKLSVVSPALAIAEISLAKNNLIGTEEFAAIHEGNGVMAKVAQVFNEYETEKTERLSLDFDDLVLESLRLLRSDRGSFSILSGRFRHVMVDEFQDTSPLQNAFLNEMVNGGDTEEGNGSFVVLGDDWQSIYGFTGASVGNILYFDQVYPQSQRFILNLNYRSTPQILEACQNLIRHNTRKIDKELRTDNPSGEEVMVLESSSEEGEAMSVVNEIDDLVQRRGFAFKDIAVLYRANFQSRVLEEALGRHKVPYHIQNGLCFYDRPEVRAILDYLRVIYEPKTEAGNQSLLNILNTPNRYLGRKYAADLKSFAQESGLFLYEALKSAPVGSAFQRRNARALFNLLEPLIEVAATLEPAGAIHHLRSTLDYDRHVTDEDIPTPDNVKLQNIDQLQMAAGRFRNLKTFLEYSDSFQDPGIQDSEGVQLMTIHKAKGLEFPVVFVVGLVEGITPTKRSDIEEERRIVFVAISRAMKLLYLCHSHTYLGQPARKSIFVDEIMGQ